MAWTLQTHEKHYPKNFNSGLLEGIWELCEPRSALDFGCGPGYYCRALSEKGCARVVGIEPNNMSSALFAARPGLKQLSVDIFKDDLTSVAELKVDASFDLVMSIEVAEHIERRLHETLFDFLVAQTRHWIVFSGARIGQGGIGHVAERAEEDWRQEFTSRGLIYREDMTLRLRAQCNARNINHRRNVMVFEKTLPN